MKKIICVIALMFIFDIELKAAYWELLIPSNKYMNNGFNLSVSGYDQVDNVLYSLTGNKIQQIDLNNNKITVIEHQNNIGVDVSHFVVDQYNKKIICSRVGRSKVFEYSIKDNKWSYFGFDDGTGLVPGPDHVSYGAQQFWNNYKKYYSYFGGYGQGQVRNWVWEYNGNEWIYTYAENNICDNKNPVRGTSNLMLGKPNSNKIYFASGAGSCGGSQFDRCNTAGWANDIGVWCWLRSIWEYDYSKNEFINILPTNSESITKEGKFVYNFDTETFYILGGFKPSSTYFSNFGDVTDFDNTVLKYNKNIDTGFTSIEIKGNPPPKVKVNQYVGLAYYDSKFKRIIWARNDGIWALNLEGQIKEALTLNYSNKICDSSIVVYEATEKDYYKYNWLINGNYNLISKENNKITIQWLNNQLSNIRLIRENTINNEFDTLLINIKIESKPKILVDSKTSYCTEDLIDINLLFEDKTIEYSNFNINIIKDSIIIKSQEYKNITQDKLNIFSNNLNQGNYFVKCYYNSTTGCEDTIQFGFSVNENDLKPKIWIENDNLVIKNVIGNDYIWFRNDSLIDRSKNNSYKPIESGLYKCQITNENNCLSEFSNEVPVFISSIDEKQFTIVNNFNKNIIEIIDYSNKFNNNVYQVFDILGNSYQFTTEEGQNRNLIKFIRALNNGTYILNMYNGTKNFNFKFIINE